jgi:hypothetical protein
MASRRRRHVVTATAALGGLVLFAWAIRQAGYAEVLDGVRRVGWGLVPVCLLAGLRFVARAEAWRACMPRRGRLTSRQALAAFLSGDALGNVTPLGLLASEPTKVFLSRHHLATREAMSSLALDNLVYAGSIGVMLVLGGVALAVAADLPAGALWLLPLVAAALLAGAAIMLRLLRGTWKEEHGPRPPWRGRIAALRASVLQLWAEPTTSLGRAFLWDMGFHVLAVTEAFLTLRWLLGDRSPTLMEAIAFEALNRVVTVALKFVPFRVGVDEASSGALAPLMAMQVTTGVTLAVIRKVRSLLWSAVGLALIAGRSREASATDRP